jgi:glycosyltransferase involved in cell wall biosynthesis
MDDVAISVVIPCFDSAATLDDTLASVFAQTRDDYELVLVDDGSRDDTRARLDAAIAAHPTRRLRVLAQANAGVAAARNRGIAHARGRYILPLDADDLIEPTMLAACAARLDADPALAIVYPDRREFGAVERHAPAGRFALAHLKYFNQLSYCAMYRRSLWQAIGGYATNVSGFDDWDFWIAAALMGARAEHLPEPPLWHRRRADSQMMRIVADYDRLFAQVIVNRQAAYSAAELAAARAVLRGEPAGAPIRAARFVFLAHFEGRAAAAGSVPTPRPRCAS